MMLVVGISFRKAQLKYSFHLHLYELLGVELKLVLLNNDNISYFEST